MTDACSLPEPSHEAGNDQPDAISVDEVVSVLQHLVRIPSVNPSGDPKLTGPQYTEANVAQYVADYFADTPCQVRVSEVCPGRPNVTVTLRGKEGAPTLLLETHMDTVKPSTDQAEPFDPVIKDDAVWGLGSCDAKASLASMMVALKRVALSDDKPEATIKLAAVVDEEFGFAGVTHWVEEGGQADAAVVGEPTMLDIVVAHKGVMRFHLETRGKSAHSSQAHQGVNAITHMGRVLHAIDNDVAPQLAAASHPLLGSPSITVGTIHGGIQANIVPDRCVIDVDRRLIPGETPDGVMRDMESRLQSLAADNTDFKYVLHPPYLVSKPLDTPVDEKIVQVARRACEAVFGQSRIIGVPYGTDGSELSSAGIPTVVIGPGTIDVAHSAHEHVGIDQLRAAVDVYTRFMRGYS